jgi:hypothetical protein
MRHPFLSFIAPVVANCGIARRCVSWRQACIFPESGIALTDRPAARSPWPRGVFAAAFAEKPAGRFMIRSRTRVVKQHPEGD